MSNKAFYTGGLRSAINDARLNLEWLESELDSSRVMNERAVIDHYDSWILKLEIDLLKLKRSSEYIKFALRNRDWDGRSD